MQNNFNYQEILKRIKSYRKAKKLSARETSLRLGYSDSFINRIERNIVELKVSTLFEFLQLIEVDMLEFVYPNPENFKRDMQIIDKFNKLSTENKKFFLEFLDKLK